MKKNILGLLLLVCVAFLPIACNNVEKEESTEVETDVTINIDENSTQSSAEIKLTEEKVEAFVKAITIIKEKQPEFEQNAKNNLTAAFAALFINNEFEKVVTEAGFKNKEEFVFTTTKIVQAITAIQTSSTSKESIDAKAAIEKQFDEQLANPKLDENQKNALKLQKEQMIKVYEDNQSVLKQLSGTVTPEEIEMVKKYYDKIVQK